MEFRRGHLEYFVAVADEGQITRAAQRLHMAQPALSQAIAQLETDLGVELLERNPRGVTLTAAGEAFLTKARTAVAAWEDAVEAARSAGGGEPATLEFGFVGTPPGVDSPLQLEAFARRNPNIDLRYRELPFPHAPTSAWLAEVDVAACHLPPPDPGVWTQPFRSELRAALMPVRHPLAGRESLDVASLLEETFIGFSPAVDPEWAGFWSLDDHRGGPPLRQTPDRATNAHEVLAALTVRDALTIVPESVGRLILGVLAGIAVSVPIADAEPCTIALSGREDRSSPQVAALRAFAARGR